MRHIWNTSCSRLVGSFSFWMLSGSPIASLPLSMSRVMMMICPLPNTVSISSGFVPMGKISTSIPASFMRNGGFWSAALERVIMWSILRMRVSLLRQCAHILAVDCMAGMTPSTRSSSLVRSVESICALKCKSAAHLTSFPPTRSSLRSAS